MKGFLSSTPIESVVIVGTGGFSLEVFDYLDAHASAGGPPVVGFIDPRESGTCTPSGIDRPYLGSLSSFTPQPYQVAVVAIGSVLWRERAFQLLWERGVDTPAFVAQSTVVSPSALIGRGAIICPMSVVNRDASVGEGALVNVHGSVGHGAEVGAHAVLSPYAALNGNAVVGARCFLGTRATVYPGIRIGDGCVVDSHTGVRAAAEPRHMISSRGQYAVHALRR